MKSILTIIYKRVSRKRTYYISYDVTFNIFSNGQIFNGIQINWINSNGGEYKNNIIHLNLSKSFFKIKHPSINQRLSEIIENHLDDLTHCHGMYGSVVKINKYLAI